VELKKLEVITGQSIETGILEVRLPKIKLKKGFTIKIE